MTFLDALLFTIAIFLILLFGVLFTITLAKLIAKIGGI